MATLVRWSPLREMDLMERRLKRLFEDVGFGPLTMPAADVYETPAEFVVELEVPGFEEKDIAVEVADHTLLVTGDVTDVREETDKTFLLKERLEKAFTRRFALPTDVDTEKLEATFARGVLEVHAPKVARSTPRKVAIGAR